MPLNERCLRHCSILGILLSKSKVQVYVTFPVSRALVFFCKFHGPVGMNGQLLTGDTVPSRPR